MTTPKYVYAVYQSPWSKISIHRVAVEKETDRYVYTRRSGLAFRCAGRLLKADTSFTPEDAVIKFIASKSADIQSFEDNIAAAKKSIDAARAGLSIVDVES